MSLTALQEYTFKSKYASWLESEKRRENWPEAIDRFCDMFSEYYKDKNISKYIERVRKSIRKKKVLGSQRGLQFGGKPVLKKHARLYNCVSSYCDRPRFFQEAMYLLMAGCGVGFSVQKHHVEKLPNLVKPSGEERLIVIDDSIEGWSDAIGSLIHSYFDGYDNTPVNFNPSLIRKKGSRLSSCSGKAPGPEPLLAAIEKIRELLNKAIESNQTKLRPIQAYDIIMHSSDAVLSGGIRRSACLALFSLDDDEMMKAKTGSWFYDNPQRARSNNSVALLKDGLSFSDFQKIIQYVKEFGEPGFVFVEDLEHIINPCCEISMYCYDEFGNSGWEGCNLSTINVSKVKSRKDFYRACRDAAYLGTMQSGFTTFKYLGEVSERIFRRESLLGVSMTGIMESPDICLDPEVQRIGAEIVKRTNRKIAKLLGINPSARTTCCKPEGTTSCLLGTSSGIHPHHAKRYIRRVQANRTEDIYNHFRATNPLACQSSVWSANDTDDVIAFTIEVKDGAKLKNQMSALDMLKAVQLTQNNWVTHGRNLDLCTKPWLNHNVSNTITVKPDEWDDVTQFIYDNRKDFCGISLLPASGDKDYPQAPFSEIFLSRELVSIYGDAALFASGLIVEAKRLFDDNLWIACDFILGILKSKGSAKAQFVEQSKKYANKYLDGDLKRLTYCLKDIDNLKYYTDLQREYKNVDYDTLVELENNVKVEDTVACAGGACQI